MKYILSFETSTKACSAAIHGDGKLLALKEGFDANSHSETLLPFAEEVILEAGITMQDLSAIAVGKGPGSYTGLRIGVSSAKGLAYALDIPVVTIDSLTLLTLKAMESNEIKDFQGELEKVYFCPMIDARRMEVYCCLHDRELKLVRNISAEIIDEHFLQNFLSTNIVTFFGNGAAKCKEVLSGDNALFLEGIYPSAQYMGELAWQKFMREEWEDVAYFEPYYLKEFVTNKPKKNILR